ncbi:acyl-coenzyme A oxidase-like protein isoform X2 [Lineus longissimus]
MSVGIKMGVMAWLFGGAVMNLGSERHAAEWFTPLSELQFTGMFAMSERGHGSNVRGIQTEAHYDCKTEEFIINTPCLDACKIYIGNALQGNYAAVFAQLYIDDICRGPHCFIVPVRDLNGVMNPGVKVEDQGLKEGLNGIDNGMLSFDHVRIPRANFLNKFADVSPDGKYTTTIERAGARFNAMLAALVGTRMALCFQSLGAMKVGLEIAIKYALRRRQFGPAPDKEVLIMEYQTHQMRLMPYLASSLALTYASRYAGSILDEDVTNHRPIVEDRALQALASGLKAYCTWEAVHALQACRECTGGMGYMEENRIASLRRDCDVFVTFEGDNMVMLQQVVKELLAQYSLQFEGSKVRGLLTLYTANTLAALKTSKFAINTKAANTVSFVYKAMCFKEDKLLRTLAARLLKKVKSDGEPPFSAWNSCLDHIITLAWSHIQRVTLEQFSKNVRKCPNAEHKSILLKFLKLFAMDIMNKDSAWFLENGYITGQMAKDVRNKFIQMCKETTVHALEVVNAFQTNECCVHAPIAGVPSTKTPWAYYPDSEMAAPKSKL